MTPEREWLEVEPNYQAEDTRDLPEFVPDIATPVEENKPALWEAIWLG